MLLAGLLLGIAVLMFALVVVQARYVNRLEKRVGELRLWAFESDPAYWRELLGPDPDLPLLNDEPELGPPDCEEQGGFHVAGDGKTCQNCPAVLV